MASHKRAVHIHPCNIIHTLELQHCPFLRLSFPAGKKDPVISLPLSVLPGGTPVIGKRHLFPDSIRPVSLRENLSLFQIAECEMLQFPDLRPRVLSRKAVCHKRTVSLPQGLQLPPESLPALFKRNVLPERHLPVRKRYPALCKNSVIFFHRRYFTVCLRHLNPVVRYVLKNILLSHNSLPFRNIPKSCPRKPETANLPSMERGHTEGICHLR